MGEEILDFGPHLGPHYTEGPFFEYEEAESGRFPYRLNLVMKTSDHSWSKPASVYGQRPTFDLVSDYCRENVKGLLAFGKFKGFRAYRFDSDKAVIRFYRKSDAMLVKLGVQM